MEKRDLTSIEEFKAHYNDKAIKKRKRKAKKGGRTKYNTPSTKAAKAITCKCNMQHIHDSRDEARYCNVLQLRLKAGDIQSFTGQKKVDVYINGKQVFYMRVDFEVITNEGKRELHEYKGAESPEWKIKSKILRAVYPEIPYIVIKKADLNAMAC